MILEVFICSQREQSIVCELTVGTHGCVVQRCPAQAVRLVQRFGKAAAQVAHHLDPVEDDSHVQRSRKQFAAAFAANRQFPAVQILAHFFHVSGFAATVNQIDLGLQKYVKINSFVVSKRSLTARAIIASEAEQWLS